MSDGSLMQISKKNSGQVAKQRYAASQRGKQVCAQTNGDAPVNQTWLDDYVKTDVRRWLVRQAAVASASTVSAQVAIADAQASAPTVAITNAHQAPTVSETSILRMWPPWFLRTT